MTCPLTIAVTFWMRRVAGVDIAALHIAGVVRTQSAYVCTAVLVAIGCFHADARPAKGAVSILVMAVATNLCGNMGQQGQQR